MIILTDLEVLMIMTEGLLHMTNLDEKIHMVQQEKNVIFQVEHLLVMIYMIEENLEICHHRLENTIAIPYHEEKPCLLEIRYRVMMNMAVDEMHMHHHAQDHHCLQFAQDLQSQDEM